jgi:ABC-type nickel/cobalt efflux system permease component RcnA
VPEPPEQHEHHEHHEHHPVHAAVEEVKSLEHEAAVGESARTPAILVGGVGLVVGAVVVILLIIAFTAYYLAK